jgi:hypothetical protein
VPEDKKSGDVSVALTGEQVSTATSRIGAKGNSRFGARRKGKHEREVLLGTEFNSAGQLMRKERIIDRKNDYYSETVINEDTGEVVRQIEEPLSRHTDRGTVRRKSNSK